MHFSLVVMNMLNGTPLFAFNDVVLPLYYAFCRLGYTVEILRNRINPNSCNVLFGVNENQRLTGFDPPSNTIIYNLEQLTSANCPWRDDEEYLSRLRDFRCWDYSQRNIDFLAAANIKTEYLPIGYVPEMTRLVKPAPVAYDVLFYGGIDARRRVVLDDLVNRGVKLYPPSGIYAGKRDLAILASRIVLNVHLYVPAVLEVARLGYLWANRRPVVSELRADTEIYPELKNSCTFSAYEDIGQTVVELLADEGRLKKQGTVGFEAFRSLDLEKSLETLVGRRTVNGQGADFVEPMPGILNIGSGLDFKRNALNLDMDARCAPDLVLDISKPLDNSIFYKTKRFGSVQLAPGVFSKIMAFNVLDTVDDLGQVLYNLLDLLEDNGEMDVRVPHWLSRSAIANLGKSYRFSPESFERFSKIYVNESGLPKAKFELVDIQAILSDKGRALLASGRSLKKLHDTIGAIDAWRVKFKKIKLTEEMAYHEDVNYRFFYADSQINWAIDDSNDYELQYQFGSAWQYWLTRINLFRVNLGYYFLRTICNLTPGKYGNLNIKKELWKAKRNNLRSYFNFTPQR